MRDSWKLNNIMIESGGAGLVGGEDLERDGVMLAVAAVKLAHGCSCICGLQNCVHRSK